MSVYVDSLRRHVTPYDEAAARVVGERNGHLWCHLFTDGPHDELHAFAQRLGLKRIWAQMGGNSVLHYDLTPPRRAHAVRLGAKEVARREAVMIWRAWRVAYPPCENTMERSCTSTVTHAEHWYNRIRYWCDEHTPWSGHYERCPDPCLNLIEALKSSRAVPGGPNREAGPSLSVRPNGAAGTEFTPTGGAPEAAGAPQETAVDLED